MPRMEPAVASCAAAAGDKTPTSTRKIKPSEKAVRKIAGRDIKTHLVPVTSLGGNSLRGLTGAGKNSGKALSLRTLVMRR
jgi:hypothetical protein